MTERELALRRRILEAFAATGEPPVVADGPELRALAGGHVVALDAAGRILMAHPFAGHRAGTRVQAGERTWWGNCAWDGLGIVAALGLRDADVTSGQITLRVRDGRLSDAAPLFHVAVAAARWWEDIAFT